MMLNPELINQLAELAGMPASYDDWAGEPVPIAMEYKTAMLEALGFDMSSETAVKKQIQTLQEKPWQSVLPEVVVLHEDKPYQVTCHLKKSQLNDTVTVILILEDGQKQTINAEPSSLEVVARKTINGSEILRLQLPLPTDLPMGYHTLQLREKTLQADCSLIIAPATCYEPEPLQTGEKIWGSGIQLYSVRSERNWGMGDFTDLKTLASELGKNGAHFVGLNPIHALYQDNPLHCSPYSPSSRLYGNVLYLDPLAVPEFDHCKKAQQAFAAESFQQRLSESRACDYVDYEKTAGLKFEILELLYEHFTEQPDASNSDRARAFAAYCDKHGEPLQRFALFNALYEHFRKEDLMNWGWPCWPEAFQNPQSAEVADFAKANEDRITYFKYLQWLAEEQFAQAQTIARDAGMMVGVYRDLAVGVDRGGADVWSDRRLFCLEASTGAPPDGLGPQGQNWGLPPFNPAALQERRYQPFIDMIRNNMRDCGALRIDHAMGLFRLWWCPNGRGAAEGAYIHYPLQDLLGIIKLESRRNGCLVFGEDLGTVPQAITDSLPPARFYSSVMGIFMQEGDSYLLPENYKLKALATLVCHDTPTLAGWWAGKDIDLVESLDFYTPERAEHERKGRQHARQAVINLLSTINELPSDTGDQMPEQFTRQLMERFSYYLARSNSQIAGIQLEDCMMIDTPVNMPGTSTEYPNWRRRLTENLESFFASEENKAFFHNLTQCRKS
ncbi:4-alpha-glucanotransferase [Endozoicomonas sp. 4G]|uniref:4-alpha-glucanotransferase n=1 Tax=Endozoicomonas sp. 4G TaxID=2872754 RepID=UPI002078AF99|nr:4-alpha-glucanotransferase [Endozoicomonas sp. 4G]